MPNSPFLLAREETPSPRDKADEPDTQLPQLSDTAITGLTLGIVLIVLLALLIWWHRHRSKQRREGATRRSEQEKWDPVQGSTPFPSRSWVDVDMERQAEEDRRMRSGYGAGVESHTRRGWVAPKWNMVAERLAQYEREQRANAMASERGRLSKPPPALTRRPTGDGSELPDGAPRGEPYLAMLWAPGDWGSQP